MAHEWPTAWPRHSLVRPWFGFDPALFRRRSALCGARPNLEWHTSGPHVARNWLTAVLRPHIVSPSPDRRLLYCPPRSFGRGLLKARSRLVGTWAGLKAGLHAFFLPDQRCIFLQRLLETRSLNLARSLDYNPNSLNVCVTVCVLWHHSCTYVVLPWLAVFSISRKKQTVENTATPYYCSFDLSTQGNAALSWNR